MLNAKNILLGLLSISQVAFAQKDTISTDFYVPALDNTLNECIGVSMGKVQQTQFGAFIPATLTHKQTAAKCGCKSAALSYSVIEILASPQPPKGMDAPEWTRIYATFSPFKPGAQSGSIKDFTFMLQTSDGQPRIKNKLILRLSCAPAK